MRRKIKGLQFSIIANTCDCFEYALDRYEEGPRRRHAMAHPALAATLPSEAEAGVAKETSRLLASRLKKDAPMQLRILDDEASQATVKLPAPAVGLLLRILEEMARGNAVTIIPVRRRRKRPTC
jgi:hypothetical protein